MWALAGRSELYTTYTPYQPELSQGVLQALFEYQSMICELTGLEVSNASQYDGPTSLVEAAHMARAATGPAACCWPPAWTLATARRSGPTGPASTSSWRTSPRRTARRVFPTAADGVAAVVVQHPERPRPARAASASCSRRRRAAGARAIQVFDPLSLGVLAPPGELGADIAVAEGQPLGNHLELRRPVPGDHRRRTQDLRRMPGRIVGETLDADGRRGFVLTLQAREQHIRREKATSNICTNQTLMAVAATVYLAWLGPGGLRELGRQCSARRPATPRSA